MSKHLGWIVAVSISFHTFLAANTWTGPGNGFNVPANWTPAAVPGPADLAIFAGATPLNPTIPAGDTESVLGVQFMGSASYTLTNNGASFNVGTSGIANLSGILQTVLIQPTTAFNSMDVFGSVTGGNVLFDLPGSAAFTCDLTFHGTASTDASTFNVSQINTGIAFADSTTAASSIFNSDTAEIIFQSNSTAGTAQFNLIQSGGGVASNGVLFSGNSSAQNAIINANLAQVFFADTSTGGSATVSLVNASQMGISANITLGSLSSDASSTIDLTSNLTVGSLGTSTTIAGQISGIGGSFTKVGAGTMTFSGPGNTYTGPTTINEGKLLLNTSIAGDAIVNSGGTLAGNGSVGGNGTINSGGRISPGNNNIAAITFNGNYTQAPGSFYLVKLSGTSSDRIDAIGTATLNGGTVQVISGVPAVGTTYGILHADGGVTGTFSSLITPSFTATLVYLPFDVFLTVTGIHSNFSPFARTSNQRHVAQQIDTITVPTPDEQLVINSLSQLSVPQLEHALDLMSGEQYANLIQTEQGITRRFIRSLYDPLRELLTGCLCCQSRSCCEYGIEPWLQVGGGRGFLDGDRNGKGFKDDYYDVSFGVQAVFGSCWVLGLAGDYSRDHIDYRLSGHSRLRTWQDAIYGAFMQPDYYIFADLIRGDTSCRMRRGIKFGEIDRHARSHPNLNHVTGYAEFGYNFCRCNVLLQPFVAFESGYYRRNRTGEHGADSLDLNIHTADATSFDSRMGFHVTSCFCDEFIERFCTQLILSMDLAWQHRFNSVGGTLHTNFSDFGNTFSIHGPRQGRDSIDGAIYLGAQVKDWLTVFAQFGGEKWDHYSIWNLTGGLEGRF